MANAVNRFIKGIVSDYNAIDVTNQHWVWPTINMRITKKGDMMVAMPITGNTKLFDLPEGYEVIGGQEYAGILYLVLYKESDSTVAVHSYPSVAEGVDGFNYELKPIPFIEGGFDFSDKLEYDGRKVDLLFTTSFDDTVDIYMNDSLNPTYILNNCFTNKGKFIDRQVGVINVPEGIRLINSSTSPATFQHLEVVSPGLLPPGNYQLYLRYVTNSFNQTLFVSQSEIISVAEILPVQYGKFKDGEYGPNYTSRALNVKLLNLDQTYAYYQIGVVCYTSNVGEAAVPVTYLIDKLYRTDERTLHIDGYEKKRSLSLDEIAAIISMDNINKSQVIIQNRYIGANWTFSGYDKEALAGYAKLVTADVIKVDDPSSHKSPTYYPYEIYPFAIVFLLSSGVETDSYPIQGKNLETGELLKNGLVLICYDHRGDTDDIRNKFIPSFQLLGLHVAIKKDPDVLGYYIVRGERIKNIISEGIAFVALDGVFARTEDSHNTRYAHSAETAKEGYCWPDTSCDAKYPIYAYTDGGKMCLYNDVAVRSRTMAKKRAGFFSVETLFNDQSLVSTFNNTLIHIQTKSVWNKFRIDDNNPNGVAFRGVSRVLEDQLKWGSEIKSVQAFFIRSGETVAKGNFTSYINDARSAGGGARPFKFEDYSTSWPVEARSSLWNDYIGLKFDGDIDLYPASPMRLLRYESREIYVASVQASFNPRTSYYFKISKIKIPDSSPAAFYKDEHNGDTYTGEITMRGHKWFGAKQLSAINCESTQGDVYQHGSTFTYATRSDINFLIRTNQVAKKPDGSTSGEYSFLPYQLERENSWAVLSSEEADMHESTKLNTGYSVTSSIKRYAGYDNKALPTSNAFITRLRNSNKRIAGSYLNAFKNFDANQSQDYDEQYGPIVGIYNLYNHLISVQYDAINMHYVQGQASKDFDIVLGSSNKFLNENVYMKATFGAQSRDHIYNTGEFIYGIDMSNFVFWKIGTGSTPEGKQIISVVNLLETLGFEKHLMSILNEVKGNILDINIGYDELHKEVFFTLLYSLAVANPPIDPDAPDDPSPKGGQPSTNTVTVIYNQESNSFICHYTIPSVFYATYNNQLLSFDKYSAYVHKEDSPQLEFFGVKYSMILSYIVTGASKETSATVKKFFESIKLRSPNHELVSIQFHTDSQEGELNPFKNEERFWLNPKYNEYHWEVPIPVNAKGSQPFSEGSVLKGEWLKVTLEYKGDEEFYLLYTNTEFNPINY